MLLLNFFEKIFSFKGARSEKGLKICPFSRMSKSKSSFLHNTTYVKKKILPRWSQNKTKKINNIRKLFQVGFVRRFFYKRKKI